MKLLSTSSVLHDWRYTAFAVFVTALIVRAAFVLFLQEGFYFPDSVHYSKAASSLISNGELGGQYNRPPGYPVFLAGVYLLFGNSILSVRLVESVMGALLAVLIALIGKRIGGDFVGGAAGILWSIYPTGIFIAGLVYPTGLLATLLALGFLCFLPESGHELSRKRVFGAGIICGLAALTAPVVLATAFGLVLWLIYWRPVDGVRLAAMLVLGTVLVVVPWILRDYHVYGRLVIVESRAVRHLPRIENPEKDRHGESLESILEHPRKFAGRFGREFLHFWTLYPDRMKMSNPEVRDSMHARDSRVIRETVFTTNALIITISILSTVPLFFLGIAGTLSMWFQNDKRPCLSLLWGTILSFALPYSVFSTQARYRIPVEPYIVVLSAFGLAHAARLYAVSRRIEWCARQVKRVTST